MTATDHTQTQPTEVQAMFHTHAFLQPDPMTETDYSARNVYPASASVAAKPKAPTPTPKPPQDTFDPEAPLVCIFGVNVDRVFLAVCVCFALIVFTGALNPIADVWMAVSAFFGGIYK